MFKDMPPTNNPVEGDIRGDPVAQRNVRYQLRTEGGARAFSVIVSFILTCKKQGVRLDKAFIALAGGADPADLFKVGQVAPNRWGGPKKKAPRQGKGPLDGLARAAAEVAEAAEAAEPEPVDPESEPEPVAAEPEPVAAEPVAAEPEASASAPVPSAGGRFGRRSTDGRTPRRLHRLRSRRQGRRWPSPPAAPRPRRGRAAKGGRRLRAPPASAYSAPKPGRAAACRIGRQLPGRGAPQSRRRASGFASAQAKGLATNTFRSGHPCRPPAHRMTRKSGFIRPRERARTSHRTRGRHNTIRPRLGFDRSADRPPPAAPPPPFRPPAAERAAAKRPKGPNGAGMPRSCHCTGRPRAALRGAIMQAAGDPSPLRIRHPWPHPLHRPSRGGHHAALAQALPG